MVLYFLSFILLSLIRLIIARPHPRSQRGMSPRKFHLFSSVPLLSFDNLQPFGRRGGEKQNWQDQPLIHSLFLFFLYWWNENKSNCQLFAKLSLLFYAQ